jgi:hypothetical protein
LKRRHATRYLKYNNLNRDAKTLNKFKRLNLNMFLLDKT